MNSSPTILWFRLGLRLGDNAALAAALKRSGPVVPVFIWAPEEEAPWEPGAASRWWLHQSLESLGGGLRAVGSELILRRGPSGECLRELIKETGAQAVYWMRRYEPAVIARDQAIRQTLQASGVAAEMFDGALLREPESVANQSGRPFQVFTPFWRHCLKLADPGPPLPTPRSLPRPKRWPKSLPLAALELEPKIKWAEGFRRAWQPGEPGAHERLKDFVARAFADYAKQRDRPDVAGTSRLSPHLHFGEISPRQIWHAVRRQAGKRGLTAKAWREGRFLCELGWREFAHHLLAHFPHTPDAPLRPDFARFPWQKEPEFLKAWQQGCTGYPIVDAGMRELRATGWMHNRVRMIAGSFLVKDLLISWSEGARWFWDTLVDADLAQNTLGWQWTAGCGADAAPYFRVFNPVTQGEKFDPQGGYVRKWCPELARLSDRWLHQPWRVPAEVLAQARIELGRTYPEPIVNHTIAREVALEAFATIRGRRVGKSSGVS